MTTVGFIGLGIMGGPMASNLVKAGTTSSATTAAGPGRRAGRRRWPWRVERRRSGRRRRRRDHDAARLARRRAGARSARTASSTNASAGHAGDRHVHHRAGRARADRRGRRSARPARPGRAGVRRRTGRDRGRAVHHGRWRGRGLRGCPAGTGSRRARPSCTSVPPVPARPSRRPTSSSSPAPPARSPRRSCFLEASGVDPEAAVRGARRRAGRQHGPRPQGGRHARAQFHSPGSASPCTTRTWASSPRPPARPAWRSRSARCRPADRPRSRRATAGSTIPALLKLPKSSGRAGPSTART